MISNAAARYCEKVPLVFNAVVDRLLKYLVCFIAVDLSVCPCFYQVS